MLYYNNLYFFTFYCDKSVNIDLRFVYRVLIFLGTSFWLDHVRLYCDNVGYNYVTSEQERGHMSNNKDIYPPTA